MEDPIYLDYNATTPIAPEVIEAIVPALRDLWGNASSAHVYGRRARQAIDVARDQVAELLGCEASEIVFTGGGTEADNAAVVGVAEALAEHGKHIVISAVEHAAVEQACRYLEGRDWQISRVPVDRDGRIDVADLERALRPETTLISLMHGQNETGVLQPVAEVGHLARSRNIVFHCDAAQSVGKLSLAVDDLSVDLLTVAGHKLYGPKGTGALYIRRGTPFVSMLRGAAHEAGRRAGTEAVPLIVGLGAACRLATEELPGRTRHLSDLRDRLEAGLRRHVPDLVVHGGNVERLPNTLSAGFPGLDAGELLSRVDGIASAAGAACHSGQPHVSAVLNAMSVEESLALGTLRLTVGRPTTDAEIDRAATLLGETAVVLRE